jgi:excisionase family DNA binding protein
MTFPKRNRGRRRAWTNRIPNPPHKLNKRLYSIPEAGQYLGRTVWSIREMIYAGKIPYIRDGRRMLLDIYDMDSWIENNRCQYNY